MHDHLELVTARLAHLDHHVRWQVAGPQLAHGTCRHCGLDVRVERAGDFFSVKLQAFGRCGASPLLVARPHGASDATARFALQP